MTDTTTSTPASPAPLILASGSPRRRELLERVGVAVDVRPADIDETPRDDETARQLVRRLALTKAEHVAARRGADDQRAVLAADTVVVVDDAIVNKPSDRADAKRMIEMLAGRTHRVLTAFCVVGGAADPASTPDDRSTMRVVVRDVATDVTFKALDADEIERYLDVAHWSDKAGAYAVQEHAAYMVSAIDGSYTNVVGLPLAEALDALASLGDIVAFNDQRR